MYEERTEKEVGREEVMHKLGPGRQAGGVPAGRHVITPSDLHLPLQQSICSQELIIFQRGRAFSDAYI